MVKYNVNFDNYKKDAAYRSLISPKLVSELKVKIVRIIVKKKNIKTRNIRPSVWLKNLKPILGIYQPWLIYALT